MLLNHDPGGKVIPLSQPPEEMLTQKQMYQTRSWWPKNCCQWQDTKTCEWDDIITNWVHYSRVSVKERRMQGPIWYKGPLKHFSNVPANSGAWLLFDDGRTSKQTDRGYRAEQQHSDFLFNPKCASFNCNYYYLLLVLRGRGQNN